MTFKNKSKRSYDESFLKLGFTELNGKPKWVISSKSLSEKSLKKNKLQHRLSTNHSRCVNKPVHFFERKLQSIVRHTKVLRHLQEPINKQFILRMSHPTKLRNKRILFHWRKVINANNEGRGKNNDWRK